MRFNSYHGVMTSSGDASVRTCGPFLISISHDRQTITVRFDDIVVVTSPGTVRDDVKRHLAACGMVLTATESHPLSYYDTKW